VLFAKGELGSLETMKYKRFIRFGIPPIFVFLGVAAFNALRHLRSLHQPVSGILVDAVAAAVLFALLAPVIDAFSGVSNGGSKT